MNGRVKTFSGSDVGSTNILLFFGSTESRFSRLVTGSGSVSGSHIFFEDKFDLI